MSEQPQVLAGMPVNKRIQRRLGVAVYVPPAGAEQVPCDHCARKMWLGPRQLAHKRATPATPAICTVCLLPALAALSQSGQAAPVATLGGKGGDYFMTDGTTITNPPNPAN